MSRQIKKYRSAFAIALVLWALLVSAVYAKDDAAIERENKIKAAFLYNFLKFVEWPKDKVSDSNDIVILSIIGESSFGDAFDAIRNKTVHEKKLVIKFFPTYSKLWPKQKEEIVKSHVLYISPSETKQLKDIFGLLKGHSVLTVADMDEFLERGGHINFVVTKKVNFEINLTAVKKAGLQLRAQLLKVAKRVIEEKKEKEEEKQSTMMDTSKALKKSD